MARYNRAEINPEYAARMCTPHFYTTAIRIIQQNKR